MIEDSTNAIVKTAKFIKDCLRDEDYSKELIAYLFSTYDLSSFIRESKLNKLQLATHFLNHARQIHLAGTTF
jgi:hypothetical protein